MSLFNTIASSAVGKRKSNTTGAIVNGSVIPAESADNYADTETDVAENNENKTYWDMLVDLCDPLKIDLQFFVWIDTCFVTSVPREETAKLVIDDRENVVKDSVSITSGTETYTRKEFDNRAPDWWWIPYIGTTDMGSEIHNRSFVFQDQSEAFPSVSGDSSGWGFPAGLRP